MQEYYEEVYEKDAYSPETLDFQVEDEDSMSSFDAGIMRGYVDFEEEVW